MENRGQATKFRNYSRAVFSTIMVDLENLSKRLYAVVAQRDTLKSEAAGLLHETLGRGEIERGEASRITGLPERSARRVLNETVAEGLLASATPEGPVSRHSLEIHAHV